MAATTRTTSKPVDVLVVDFFDVLRPIYRAEIPADLHVLQVGSTSEALVVLEEHTPQAVVVQGLSKENVTDRLESVFNTVKLLLDLINAGFTGPIYVVSSALAANDARDIRLLARNIRVMEKARFLVEAPNLLAPLTNLGRIWAELELHWDDEQADGPLCILETLMELEASLKMVGPHKLINYLAGYIYRGSECQCWADIIPLEHWLHHHHDIVDGAFRDLLVTYGKLDQLILELELDLASPDVYVGVTNGPFGPELRKSYSEWCLRFLQEV